ncbi:MAG TPA: hypothetical protein PLY87_08990 [Planctomycetaceae bacterium]|nr:hypothetical protein [Planctomycetaceae bacterium]
MNPYEPPENKDSLTSRVSQRWQLVAGAFFCIMGLAITMAGRIPTLAGIVLSLFLIAIVIGAAVSRRGNRR